MNKTYLLIGLIVVLIGGAAIFAGVRAPTQPANTTRVTPQMVETPEATPEVPDNTTQGETDATATTSTTNTTPSPAPATAEKTYTLADVALHNNATSCWSAVNGAVYDLTSAIDKHPGGPEKMKSICGKDGSTAFTNQHGGQEKPEMFLAQLKIGVLVQ